MAFNITSTRVSDEARLTLIGELDAASAPAFRQAIEAAAATRPSKLVLFMHDLDYMASAGVRALVFAKQKMGVDVEIYVIGAQERVQEILMMTGMHNAVIMQDQYE